MSKITCHRVTSSLSILYCRIKLLQLDARIFCCEAPVDRSASLVACRTPGAHLPLHRIYIRQSPAQTLARQHAEFAFGHIQPTPMLRRVHKLQPLQQRTGHSPLYNDAPQWVFKLSITRVIRLASGKSCSTRRRTPRAHSPDAWLSATCRRRQPTNGA